MADAESEKSKWISQEIIRLTQIQHNLSLEKQEIVRNAALTYSINPNEAQRILNQNPVGADAGGLGNATALSLSNLTPRGIPEIASMVPNQLHAFNAAAVPAVSAISGLVPVASNLLGNQYQQVVTNSSIVPTTGQHETSNMVKAQAFPLMLGQQTLTTNMLVNQHQQILANTSVVPAASQMLAPKPADGLNNEGGFLNTAIVPNPSQIGAPFPNALVPPHALSNHPVPNPSGGNAPCSSFRVTSLQNHTIDPQHQQLPNGQPPAAISNKASPPQRFATNTSVGLNYGSGLLTPAVVNVRNPIQNGFLSANAPVSQFSFSNLSVSNLPANHASSTTTMPDRGFYTQTIASQHQHLLNGQPPVAVTKNAHSLPVVPDTTVPLNNGDGLLTSTAVHNPFPNRIFSAVASVPHPSFPNSLVQTLPANNVSSTPFPNLASHNSTIASQPQHLLNGPLSSAGIPVGAPSLPKRTRPFGEMDTERPAIKISRDLLDTVSIISYAFPNGEFNANPAPLASLDITRRASTTNTQTSSSCGDSLSPQSPPKKRRGRPRKYDQCGVPSKIAKPSKCRTVAPRGDFVIKSVTPPPAKESSLISARTQDPNSSRQEWALSSSRPITYQPQFPAHPSTSSPPRERVPMSQLKAFVEELKVIYFELYGWNGIDQFDKTMYARFWKKNLPSLSHRKDRMTNEKMRNIAKSVRRVEWLAKWQKYGNPGWSDSEKDNLKVKTKYEPSEDVLTEMHVLMQNLFDFEEQEEITERRYHLERKSVDERWIKEGFSKRFNEVIVMETELKDLDKLLREGRHQDDSRFFDVAVHELAKISIDLGFDPIGDESFAAHIEKVEEKMLSEPVENRDEYEAALSLRLLQDQLSRAARIEESQVIDDGLEQVAEQKSGGEDNEYSDNGDSIESDENQKEQQVEDINEQSDQAEEPSGDDVERDDERDDQKMEVDRNIEESKKQDNSRSLPVDQGKYELMPAVKEPMGEELDDGEGNQELDGNDDKREGELHCGEEYESKAEDDENAAEVVINHIPIDNITVNEPGVVGDAPNVDESQKSAPFDNHIRGQEESHGEQSDYDGEDNCGLPYGEGDNDGDEDPPVEDDAMPMVDHVEERLNGGEEQSHNDDNEKSGRKMSNTQYDSVDYSVIGSEGAGSADEEVDEHENLVQVPKNEIVESEEETDENNEERCQPSTFYGVSIESVKSEKIEAVEEFDYQYCNDDNKDKVSRNQINYSDSGDFNNDAPIDESEERDNAAQEFEEASKGEDESFSMEIERSEDDEQLFDDEQMEEDNEGEEIDMDEEAEQDSMEQEEEAEAEQNADVVNSVIECIHIIFKCSDVIVNVSENGATSSKEYCTDIQVRQILEEISERADYIEEFWFTHERGNEEDLDVFISRYFPSVQLKVHRLIFNAQTGNDELLTSIFDCLTPVILKKVRVERETDLWISSIMETSHGVHLVELEVKELVEVDGDFFRANALNSFQLALKSIEGRYIDLLIEGFLAKDVGASFDIQLEHSLVWDTIRRDSAIIGPLVSGQLKRGEDRLLHGSVLHRVDLENGGIAVFLLEEKRLRGEIFTKERVEKCKGKLYTLFEALPLRIR